MPRINRSNEPPRLPAQGGARRRGPEKPISEKPIEGTVTRQDGNFVNTKPVHYQAAQGQQGLQGAPLQAWLPGLATGFVNTTPVHHQAAQGQQGLQGAPLQAWLPGPATGFMNTTPGEFRPAPGQMPLQDQPFIIHYEAPLPPNPAPRVAPMPPQDVLTAAAALMSLSRSLHPPLSRTGDTTIMAPSTPRSLVDSLSTPPPPSSRNSEISHGTNVPPTPRQDDYNQFGVGTPLFSPLGSPRSP